MRKLYKEVALWLMTTKAYKFFMNHIIWRLRFSNYYTKLTGEQYHHLYQVLQPGDILLTKDNAKATSFIVPGEFPHAALCIDKSERFPFNHPEIVEMVHEGFNKAWAFDVCKESDRVAIIRCLDWDADYTRRVIEAAKSFEGTEYDISFSLGVQTLYCSELIFQADCIAGAQEGRQEFRAGRYTGSCRMQISLADLAGLGRPYISPDGLAKAPNMKCIYDTAGELTGLLGDEIRVKLMGAAQ